jgi:hypothetical protein
MKNSNCLIRFSALHDFLCFKKKYTELEARNKETQDIKHCYRKIKCLFRGKAGLQQQQLFKRTKSRID